MTTSEQAPSRNARSIVLVRHGETFGNVQDTAQGQYDSLLTERGHRQAQSLALRFRDSRFTVVYSSDSTRAKETAAPIVEALTDHRLELRTDLRETLYGDYDNVPWSEIRDKDPDFFWEWISWETRSDAQWPNGECERDMWIRVARFSNEIVQTHEGLNDTILVIAHGGPIQSMVAQLLGLRIRDQWRFIIDNASVTTLTEHPFMRNVWQAKTSNDTSHLGAQAS